jgi:hypothetical protein
MSDSLKFRPLTSSLKEIKSGTFFSYASPDQEPLVIGCTYMRTELGFIRIYSNPNGISYGVTSVNENARVTILEMV